MEKLQRRFGAGIGIWLRTAVAEEGRTRGSLARGLCEVADWRNAKGDLCLASARGRVRVRNAENRIHASGFARGASNLRPSLDIPDRNCRTNGTLLFHSHFRALRTRKSCRQAVFATARKLVRVIHAVLKNRKPARIPEPTAGRSWRAGMPRAGSA